EEGLFSTVVIPICRQKGHATSFGVGGRWYGVTRPGIQMLKRNPGLWPVGCTTATPPRVNIPLPIVVLREWMESAGQGTGIPSATQRFLSVESMKRLWIILLTGTVGRRKPTSCGHFIIRNF